MRDTGDDSHRTSLWVIDRDGGVPEQLTNPQTSTDSDPDWSAATGQVLFERTTRDGVQAWTVGVDGGQPEHLTSTSPIHVPTWSPDGTEIAYTTEVGDERVQRVMDAEGSFQRTLLTSSEHVDAPAWGSR